MPNMVKRCHVTPVVKECMLNVLLYSLYWFILKREINIKITSWSTSFCCLTTVTSLIKSFNCFLKSQWIAHLISESDNSPVASLDIDESLFSRSLKCLAQRTKMSFLHVRKQDIVLLDDRIGVDSAAVLGP